MKKATIEVRIKRNYMNPGVLIGVIKRVLRAEIIGNFNPVFCTYHNSKHLVNSLTGDLSDPFRRSKSYLETLYIEI